MSSRRHFLKTVSAAAMGAVTGPILNACGAGPRQARATGSFSGGNVNNLSLGQPMELGEPVVVVLDANGLYAMSTICTHAGCDMQMDGTISSSGLRCLCHGSRFSINGQVTRGPAFSPLEHYAVQVADNGDITVDADMIVSPDTRTPVPG